LKNLRVGVHSQNLLSIKTSGDTKDRFPFSLRLGLFYPLIKERLLWGMDLNYSGLFTYHLGMEYLAPQIVGFSPKLRIGTKTDSFSLGMGIGRHTSGLGYDLDYAFAVNPLGSYHFFSLNFCFGALMSVKRETRALEYYQEALIQTQEGLYRKAKKSLERCLKLGGEEEEMKKLYEQVTLLTKMLKKEALVGKEKEKELLRKSVNHYLKGEFDKAVNFLQYVLSLNAQNKSAWKILEMVSRETKEEIKPPSLEKGITLVEQKLWEALNDFYEGKYDLTIKKCQEVLELEPRNILAYKRIGSAYFAMGNREKAREYWKKGLEIDPTDEELRSFLKMGKKKEKEKEKEKEEK
jgi:tetratricopeptide (TPR) repeat protein